MDVMKLVNHKAERTEDLEKVLVGKKKNIPDKVIVTFYEAGNNENEDITAQIPVGVQLFKRYTQPYKGSNKKVKARAGKLINPDLARYADEHLFDRDIGVMITEMYPDKSVFDDDDTACEILEQYFHFISIEEAKELVMALY